LLGVANLHKTFNQARDADTTKGWSGWIFDDESWICDKNGGGLLFLL